MCVCVCVCVGGWVCVCMAVEDEKRIMQSDHSSASRTTIAIAIHGLNTSRHLPRCLLLLSRHECRCSVVVDPPLLHNWSFAKCILLVIGLVRLCISSTTDRQTLLTVFHEGQRILSNSAPSVLSHCWYVCTYKEHQTLLHPFHQRSVICRSIGGLINMGRPLSPNNDELGFRDLRPENAEYTHRSCHCCRGNHFSSAITSW